MWQAGAEKAGKGNPEWWVGSCRQASMGHGRNKGTVCGRHWEGGITLQGGGHKKKNPSGEEASPKYNGRRRGHNLPGKKAQTR